MKTRAIFLTLTMIFLNGMPFCPAAQNKSGSTGRDDGIRVVVIDPGHGGIDPGAVYGHAREKEIVLDIALRLGNYIEQSYPEIKVIYTRKRDIFVPLYRRAAIANDNNADLFISVHVNAVSRGRVQGTETYVLGQHRSEENLEVAKRENEVILFEEDYSQTYEGFDPTSPESYIMFELVQDEYLEQSVMFASAIQNQFRERANRIDRSVRQAGFLVLRRTTMPGVLVETGFLSHPSDRRYLMSETGRDYLASAIYRAFRDYKRNVEQKSRFSINPKAVKQETGAIASSEKDKRTTPTTASRQPDMAESGHPVTVESNHPAEESKDISKPDHWYTVQVSALKKPLEIVPGNFKGEKEIYERQGDGYYRYYCGKYATETEAREAKRRLNVKFNEAFVVLFKNKERIPLW